MLVYIARRLFLAFAVALGVTMLTFFMMHLAPGDVAEMVAIARYGAENLNREEIERIRKAEGLDAPVYVQYAKWLARVAKGDFGRSLTTGEPVLEEILARFPATLKLALAAMIVSLLIAIPAGIVAAVKQHSLLDYLGTTAALIGISMPHFWLGLLLILLFAVRFSLFPVCGYGSLRHTVLPALTLGSGMAAVTMRLTKSSMLEALGQDYVTFARAKGLAEKAVILRHALRNAFIPVATVIGLQFGHLLEGAVVVESVFAWPGIGKLLVDAVFARDFALIQGCVLIFALCFVLINLLVDISYAYLDPRIRYERREGS